MKNLTKKALAVGASLLALCLSTLLLFSACSGGEQTAEQPGNVATVNLIPMHRFAHMVRETGIVNLSSPLNTFYLHKGWKHPFDPEDGGPPQTVAWDRESVLRYSVLLPHDRWIIFTASTAGEWPGPRYQQLDLLVGDEQIGSVEFGAEPQQFQVRIPAKLQQVGDNFITFRFSILRENTDFLTSRKRHEEYPFPNVAAYLSEIKIKFGDEHESEPMLYETPDELEAIKQIAEGKYLSQQVRSRLSYAFEVHPGAQLSFSGAVQTPTGDPEDVKLSIELRTDDAPEYEEAWSMDVTLGPNDPSQSFEGDIDLSSYAGKYVEIRLGADSPQVLARSAVIWRSLEMSMPAVRSETPAPAQRASAEVKNVIFIVLDAARAENFGVYGSDLDATPTIDAFAKDALVFTNAVAAAPYTITSISTLFTGLLPEAHGVRKINQSLPDEFETMAKAFKRSGYYTVALSGTQFLMPKFGLTDEFDQVIALRNDEFKEASVTTMEPERIREGVEAAAASGKPVFLYAHFLPPHWPYRPPAPFDSFYTSGKQVTMRRAWMIKTVLELGIIDPDNPDLLTYTRRYYNNLRYADHVVQQLFEQLKENGLYENSLIIVTADHGEALGEHREFGHNTTVYEEMIRVPLIMHMPGVAPARIERTVGLIDMFPTFIDLFGLQAEPAAFQGRSLAPLFSGGTLAGKDFYYARTFHATKLYFMMRGDRFKYISEDYRDKLIDLENDPDELGDVRERYPVLAMALRQRALMTIAANEALRGNAGQEVELTEEEQDELRDLGYIQ